MLLSGSITAGAASCKLGGLVGENAGTITDCYANGEISGGDGSESLGGIVGIGLRGSLRHCYATRTVLYGTDCQHVAAVVGYGVSQEVSRCYYLRAGNTIGPRDWRATALSLQEMRHQSSFLDWDFETVWMICEGRGYPRLRWEGVICESVVIESTRAETALELHEDDEAGL